MALQAGLKLGHYGVLSSRGAGGMRGRMYDVDPDSERFLMIKAVSRTEEEEGDRPQVVLVQNWFEELERRVASTM